MSGSSLGPPSWLTLADDERIWLHLSPSRNLVLVALSAGFVLLLVMSVVVAGVTDLRTGRALSFVVLLLIVGLLVAAFLYIRRLDYVLTSTRAVVAVGFFSKTVETVELDQVHDVTVEQSRLQRLVRVGTLRFVGMDEDVAFALIDDPLARQEEALRFVDV